MSVNSITLVGRLGAAPEERVTSSGKRLCTMNVATDWWDKHKSEKTADWHRVVVWEPQSEKCIKYLDTGSQVAVEGSIRTRTYPGEDGKQRYWTEVIARRVTFLGGGRSQRLHAVPASGGAAAPGAPIVDDDIPF